MKGKVKEGKLEELKKISGEEKKVIKPYRVKEEIPSNEPDQLPGYISSKNYFENKEMVEKWLSSTERSFKDMSSEMQEETILRYTQVRTLICKNKVEMSSSCIGCLIGSTIDCPLFKTPKLKRMAK